MKDYLVISKNLQSLPMAPGTPLQNNLRFLWMGNLFWVAFYRMGMKPEPPYNLEEFAESQTVGWLYSQLLNLAIGIEELTPGFNAREMWQKAIAEQIEQDYLNLEENGSKGHLKVIHARNAKHLKALKNFEFTESSGTAMSEILVRATAIARGMPKDSKTMTAKRRRFRSKFWDPYIKAAVDAMKETQSAKLLIEKDAALYLGGEGRARKRLFPPVESKGFASGQARMRNQNARKTPKLTLD
jgi:hypothetical protein